MRKLITSFSKFGLFAVAFFACFQMTPNLGSMLLYFDGTNYVHSLQVMELFWPSIVHKWLVILTLCFFTGAAFSAALLKRIYLAGSTKPEYEIASFLIVVSAVILGCGLSMAMPLTHFVGKAAAPLFWIFCLLTLALFVSAMLFKATTFRYTDAVKCLILGYLPLPIALKVLLTVFPTIA